MTCCIFRPALGCCSLYTLYLIMIILLKDVCSIHFLNVSPILHHLICHFFYFKFNSQWHFTEEYPSQVTLPALFSIPCLFSELRPQISNTASATDICDYVKERYFKCTLSENTQKASVTFHLIGFKTEILT